MLQYINKIFLILASTLFVLSFISNASAQLLNEIVVDPNGDDENCEYIEIIGTPNLPIPNNYYLVSIEGDSTENPGTADFVVHLSGQTFGSNGILIITANDRTGLCGNRSYGSPRTTVIRDTDLDGGGLENGTNSWLLIRGQATPIVEGVDYDTDDNGTLEGLNHPSLTDSIGWSDGGVGDIVYGSVSLPPTAGGTPDMATRFVGSTQPVSASSWYYGEMLGFANSVLYDRTQVSENFPECGGSLSPGYGQVIAFCSFSKRIDFDNDGRTDFATVRNSTQQNSSEANDFSADAGNLTWYINRSSSNSLQGIAFGLEDDKIIAADFDGDFVTDISIWRPGVPGEAAFYILQSLDFTVRVEKFGQAGDDPTVVGDFDGDGVADPAVWRSGNDGSSEIRQATFYYKASSNNPNGDITYVPWGLSSDLGPAPGDFNGDGRQDFAVRRNVNGQLQFIILRSGGSGGFVNYLNWGLPSDIYVPGDYDEDGRDDFCVVRNENGKLRWYIWESRSGGMSSTPILWGLETDIIAVGDYDGDFRLDITVWRPSEGNFYIRRSSDNQLQVFKWGMQGDKIVANWNVN